MDVARGYSIAFRGLKNGVHDFDFEVGGALFEAFGSTEIKGGACRAHVALTKSEAQLVADVSIRGAVVVACDRCLEDCSIPIDFEGRLLVKFSDPAGEYDGEVLWLTPRDDEVDLAQYIYESNVLSLPYQRVHPEGECDPEMLGRFRIVSDAEFSAIEAAAGGGEGAEEDEGENDGAGEAEEAGGRTIERPGRGWEKLAALKERMEHDAEKKK